MHESHSQVSHNTHTNPLSDYKILTKYKGQMTLVLFSCKSPNPNNMGGGLQHQCMYAHQSVVMLAIYVIF